MSGHDYKVAKLILYNKYSSMKLTNSEFSYIQYLSPITKF